jgi:hypothetical protein
MAGQQPVEDGRERPYVPAISMAGALCHPDRDRRDEPGDDETARHAFYPCYFADEEVLDILVGPALTPAAMARSAS